MRQTRPDGGCAADHELPEMTHGRNLFRESFSAQGRERRALLRCDLAARDISRQFIGVCLTML